MKNIIELLDNSDAIRIDGEIASDWRGPIHLGLDEEEITKDTVVLETYDGPFGESNLLHAFTLEDLENGKRERNKIDTKEMEIEFLQFKE